MAHVAAQMGNGQKKNGRTSFRFSVSLSVAKEREKGNGGFNSSSVDICHHFSH